MSRRDQSGNSLIDVRVNRERKNRRSRQREVKLFTKGEGAQNERKRIYCKMGGNDVTRGKGPKKKASC